MRTAREATAKIEYQSLQTHPYLEPLTRVVELPYQRRGLSVAQKWGYGLLCAAFVFVGIQGLRCGIVSVAKLEGLLRQQTLVQEAHTDVTAKNALLKDKISLYASPQGVEEMARERLDMVGEDEILVRLHPAGLAQR